MNNPYTGGGNLGMGSSAPSNPYLQSQAGGIAQTATRNLQNNILPGIDSGAVAAGGYGGSRQGIAEGNAIGQTNQDITNATANLYGNAYAQDQNYNLGMGSISNQAQANQNQFYTQQRGLDQSGAQLGSNLVNNANAGLVGQGQGVYGVGTTKQQAPWQVTNNAGNAFSQYAGLGGSQINTQQGSTLGAVLGGAQLGSSLISNLGLGQTNYTSPNVFGSYSNPAGNGGSGMPSAGTYDPNTGAYTGSYLPSQNYGS